MYKDNAKLWRLLDTGVRTATENIALDETILEARSKNLIPNTIRLLQFAPPAVLVGYHQAIENEVRINYCNNNGIDIQRRVTGGGTIYFDTTQLGWEVIAKFGDLGFHRVAPKLFKIVSEGIIAGLRKLGINAQFRPRNDIEVYGRKISGTGGTEMGDAFLFQGTLLIDFDAEAMVKALRIPVEKLKSHEIDSIKDRVTWIHKELCSKPSIHKIKKAVIKGFEQAFNIRLKPRPLTTYEEKIYKEKLKKIKKFDWINKAKPAHSNSYIVTLKKRKGVIKMLLGIEPNSQTIKYVNFLGDFFVSPKNTIYDLECALKFKEFSLAKIAETIFSFVKKEKGRLIGFSPKDFIYLFSEVQNKTFLRKLNLNVEDSNNLFTVNSTYEQIFKTNIKILLLPYCAKGIKCQFRKTQGCIKCGTCTTGGAHELARTYGLTSITITSFRHLMKVLRSIRTKEKGFIGLCCESFYVRHKEDMEKHSIPGLLINIQNQTCYDLDLAYNARLGNFDHQTDLPIPLLNKVLEANKNGF